MIFFEDPNALAELRRIKEEHLKRRMLASSCPNESDTDTITTKTLRDELSRRHKRRGKDCYSLVQEGVITKPYMSRILQSTDFAPAAGVKHIENILQHNSPCVSGGTFRPANPNLISKNEFEARRSKALLK